MGFLIFLIGAVLGSFYLVIGKRLPKNEDVVKSRSRCDNCKHVLSWWELIPIVSYIILGGKCHKCKKRIDPLHLIVEIATGGLFLFSYLYFGFSYEMYMFMTISSLLILIFVSDFSYSSSLFWLVKWILYVLEKKYKDHLTLEQGLNIVA